MHPENITVFDFDGTVIRCNSFRVITGITVTVLLRKAKLKHVLYMLFISFLRKANILSHLDFKKRVVQIFEDNLSENEKRQICQSTFDKHVNRNVLDAMIRSNNCIISTASPHAFVSRMRFGKDVPIISAVDPKREFENQENIGEGKIKNLKALFRGQEITVEEVYTDSFDDMPLIELSKNAYFCSSGIIIKIK